ncbi:class I SAM-dependent methyltransferase [Intrasporangium sp.]|uniref:class I SAM-dependent methyltransferase n=1 Tax=Intrasporangium sp. TaxID=1925024 RepID=UPI003464D635
MSWPQGSAGVFCRYVLHHVPDDDLRIAVRELARVTASGGFLMLDGHVGEKQLHQDRGLRRPPDAGPVRASQPRDVRAPFWGPGMLRQPEHPAEASGVYGVNTSRVLPGGG